MNKNAALPWWLGAITGFVFILVGVAMIMNPALAALDLIVLLGLYWLIAGVIDTIALAFDRSKGHTGLRLAGNVIGIIAGLLIINNAILATVITVEFFTYLIAFAFLFNGFVHMFIGSRTKANKAKWSWGSLIVGVLYMLFGLYIIVGPTLLVAISFVWATGIFAVIAGALIVTSAIAFKNAR